MITMPSVIMGDTFMGDIVRRRGCGTSWRVKERAVPGRWHGEERA